MIVTLIIIAITCAVTFSSFNQPRLLDDLLFWPPGVERGEYWRLITHGFVHADGQHLLFNMITLFFFGRAIEPFFAAYIGIPGFVLFYLGGIVISILPSWRANRHNPNYRSLGASGAVSAILFTYIFVAPWSILYIFVIPMPAIVFAALYVAYSYYANNRGMDNINHSAHLWGGGYGIVFAAVMEPALPGHFVSSLMAPLS